MRLSRLIVHGFKSFADRTEFVFDAPITGVVGPNGCGKSNVVDAVKWVLGEQSAKSLRGEAMLDVVFNGSGDRKPAPSAEVTLVFDNPANREGARRLPIEADAVSVGRHLSRDGDSHYTLNNRNVRLKDVRELFLDTGVGVGAYSVIEQGRVAQMLEANPSERRLIFEEAAGISRFKAQKREAQRKLERVDQNLLRVNDIVEEVEKRLRSVKVQAGRARTYKEHADRLSALRLDHALREYHLLAARKGELSKAQDNHRFRLDDATTDLQKRQDDLGNHRRRGDELSAERQRADYERVQTEAKIGSAQQRQRHAQQQAKQVEEQSASLEADRTGAGRKRDETAASLDAESKRLGELSRELEAARGAIAEKEHAFRDGQRRANDLSQQAEKRKAAILAAMRQASAVSSRLASIDIHRNNIAQQQKRLADRRHVVVGEMEAASARRDEVTQQLAGVDATIVKHQQQHDAKRAEAASLGQQIARTTEQLGAAKEHRSGLLSRQKLLRDLEARREGVSDPVRALLKRRDADFPFVRGLVADALRVDVEHAAVVEAALDGRDQWLIADSLDAAASAREAFESLPGRVNVVCRDGGENLKSRISNLEFPNLEFSASGSAAARTPPVRLAADLVRHSADDAPVVAALLGTTAVVPDLDAALALRSDGPAGWRYVTRAGEVVEADGTLKAGPPGAAMGLLSRRSELDAIAGQVAEVEGRIAALSAEVAAGNQQARDVERATSELRNAVHEAKTHKVDLSGRLASARDKLAALERERPVIEKELASLLDQSGRLKGEEAKLREQAAALDTDQSAGEAEVKQIGGQQSAVSADLKRWGDELTAVRVTFGQVQEKQLGSRQAVDRQRAAVAELGQQLNRIEKAVLTLGDRRAAAARERGSAEQEEKSLAEARAALVAGLATLAEESEAVKRHVRDATESVEHARTARTAVEKSAHETDVALSQVSTKLDNAVARAADDLQLDLPARHAELAEQPGGYEPPDLDWDDVADEIKLLREKIGRLGNVNLDAIGEMEELEGRSTFLAEQVKDLADGKAQLTDLIDAINRESSARFEQTFNAVREHFQGLFRKLFGGGKADVYLETEVEAKGEDGQIVRRKVDVLDAGIEIIARPPGKQPVSISQLSGGEKTMTCVALLMSVFKSRPSPFCILDEVDAALDEANNDRFNLIVQEFLEQSQFIVITHSKRTMRIADVLYGVTMQEPGVSKRVAVRFDQVEADGRIKPEATAA